MVADEFRGGATVTPPSTNGKRSATSKEGLETDVLSDAQREHQIKTELAVIYGFSATLEQHWEDLSDAERRHSVAAIGRATEQLMQQTERLLHDAKRDAAGRARPVGRVDVAALVRVAAARWNEASETTVVADDSGRPLYAWADTGGLQQVLGHLVDNAIKYSPGGEQVSIRMATAGPWVSIDVTDRGVGIPRDINVFAPFQRADSASHTSAGVGLGLHVARRVVEAMGGSLTARRNSHGGSTFALRVRRDSPAP
jgi:two-component system, OmpR family, sensor histidine kinase KdpD